MINWLVQSTQLHPNLARGVPLAGLLCPEEEAQFAALKTSKRRRDWLLGRWTAKRLLQAIVRQETGKALPLDTLQVLNGRSGDPRVLIDGQPAMSLSISHSNCHAFCAALERPSCTIGADIERIEARSDDFVADYFTTAEQALVHYAGEAMRNTLITAVWSAKEAVLKALRLGLIVDTRSVTCLIEPPATPPQEWIPFAISYDGRRLAGALPPLAGWWRVMDEFVLTLVA